MNKPQIRSLPAVGDPVPLDGQGGRRAAVTKITVRAPYFSAAWGEQMQFAEVDLSNHTTRLVRIA